MKTINFKVVACSKGRLRDMLRLNRASQPYINWTRIVYVVIRTLTKKEGTLFGRLS